MKKLLVILLLAAPPAFAEPPDLNMDDLRRFSHRFNMKVDVCARLDMRKVLNPDGTWKCRISK